jgi:hypothetical protein
VVVKVERPTARVPPDELASGEAEAAAEFVRAEWRMGGGPAGHLIRFSENKGVLVVFSLPQTAAVDAFSIEAAARR